MPKLKLWMRLLIALFSILEKSKPKKTETPYTGPSRHVRDDEDPGLGTFQTRNGKLVQLGESWEAIGSGDIDRMIRAAQLDDLALDRHYLLSALVGALYRQRKEPVRRQQCREYAEIYISELPGILPSVEESVGTKVQVAAFQQYSQLLTEDGEFDRAIEVCELAIRLGTPDRTKTGYQGRIERIRKKAVKAQKESV